MNNMQGLDEPPLHVRASSMPDSIVENSKSIKTTEGTWVNTSTKVPPRASRHLPQNSKYSYINTNKASES